MPSKQRKTRAVIVDDHPLIRQGIVLMLSQQPDLQIVGEAEGQAAALKVLNVEKPDLVVTDITLKEGNGIDFTREAKGLYPEMKFLVVSMHDEMLYAPRAFKAGASGYVMKEAAATTLIEAVQSVIQGGTYMSKALANQVLANNLGSGAKSPQSGVEKLSNRELEIFVYISNGRSTRQISETLGLSVKTVETHVAHIKVKVGAQNSRELMQRAVTWQMNGKIVDQTASASL